MLNYVVKNQKTGNIIEKLLIKYDSLLKIEEIKYLNGYIDYKKTWDYNKQKEIIKESYFDYVNNNQKPFLSIFYNYSNYGLSKHYIMILTIRLYGERKIFTEKNSLQKPSSITPMMK